MKFRRLTKDELETLTEDFTIFLATQGIDKEQWDEFKENDLKKVDGVLDVFSDMIFEKALASCRYMERISETEMHTYLFNEKNAHLVSVRMKDAGDANFLDGHLSDVFMDLLKHQKIEIWQGMKEFKKDRSSEMFEIMQTGAVMSKGELYRTLIKQK